MITTVLRERWIAGFALLVILAVCSLAGFRWPVDNGRITSTFGEPRADHFHDGIDVVGPTNRVYPVADGSVIYSWNKALFPLDQYSGSGNYQILNHTQGFVSMYLHLADSAAVSGEYAETDMLGSYANTGRSFGDHVHLTFWKGGSFDSLNAIVTLPPISDQKAPIFGDIGVQIDDRAVRLRDGSKVRLTKQYPLLINVWDVIQGGEKLGVYSIVVEKDGKQIADRVFDRLTPTKEGLIIGNGRFTEVFGPEGFYKFEGVSWVSGPNRFRVTATDFNGNKSQKEYTLDINLDVQQ